MFELAYNLSGEPFDVPLDATAWRVRKLKPKGAPEVVYGRDGLPLFCRRMPTLRICGGKPAPKADTDWILSTTTTDR